MNGAKLACAALVGLSAASASAQEHHATMTLTEMSGTPTEPGQGAFAAIAEIVALLQSDPATDWASVDIEALRQHLIDMDNVTMRSEVAVGPIPGGARFQVTSPDLAVANSIRRMLTAHTATMDGSGVWQMTAVPSPAGAEITVIGDEAQVRALGFVGLMTVGMHHQAHHLAIAKGTNPHD